MKHTDGLFSPCSARWRLDYPDVQSREVLVDALTMQLVQRPEEFDVLVLPEPLRRHHQRPHGGARRRPGVAPGANIGEHAAVFEATHGSAPKYTGQNKVNPTAMILSGKLMLEHLGERDAPSASKQPSQRSSQRRAGDLRPEADA
jgi:isocitrate dehydrogenase (NAD+)